MERRQLVVLVSWFRTRVARKMKAKNVRVYKELQQKLTPCQLR